MTRFVYLFFALSIVLVSGCSSMKPQDFADGRPTLDLFSYFDGETHAWGYFEDRFGKVRRQFNVSITGTVEGDILTLDEDFLYADGETDNRVWTIRKMDGNIYVGTADDIVGQAHGISSGNALNWTYQMDLPINGSKWRVTFDDWLLLQDGNVLLNRAAVTKWGFELGRVSLFFMKAQDAGQLAERTSR